MFVFFLNLNCVLQDHKCFLVLHAYHVLLGTVVLLIFPHFNLGFVFVFLLR